MTDKQEALKIRETEMNKQGIQLKTFVDLVEFSELVVKSGLAPKAFKDKESVMIAIQFGLEVGLAPMQALQGVAVINGMPSLYGDAAKALCLSDPVCVWVKEGFTGSIKDGTLTAWCESLRAGHDEPLRTEFSIEDAKLANLWGKDGTWKQYPKRMLMFRARGFNLRDNFTDILKGFKTAEEVADYEDYGTTKVHSKRKMPPTASQTKSNLPPHEDVDFEEVD